MSRYPEIPCNKVKNIGTGEKMKPYRVRKYGLNGVVYEEELIPIPSQKIIRTLKEDGTENTSLRITEAL